MTGITPRRVLLGAASLLALLAGGAAGQDQGPDPDELARDGTAGEAGHRVVASINGQPITATDVHYQMALLTRDGPEEAELEANMVRRIAEQILLAGEAKRLGLDLTASQVDDYWFRRFNIKPDYEGSAAQAGTTVAQQRALAKRVVLSEIYLLNKVGIRFDPGVRISPDLALKRMVEVTPRQLREYFNDFQARLDQPAGVSYAIYPCPDAATARATADTLRAEGKPDMRPVKETAPLDMLPEIFPFAPELAEFIRNGVVGAVSDAVHVEGVVLVVQIAARLEPEPADFERVQEELRNRIQGSLLVQARQKLVKDLTRDAVYWPVDLFDEPEPAPEGAASR